MMRRKWLMAGLLALAAVLSSGCAIVSGAVETGTEGTKDLFDLGAHGVREAGYTLGVADRAIEFDRSAEGLWASDPLSLYKIKPRAQEYVSKTLTLAKDLYDVGPEDTKSILGILGDLDGNNDMLIEEREARENATKAISTLADKIKVGPKTGLPPDKKK